MNFADSEVINSDNSNLKQLSEILQIRELRLLLCPRALSTLQALMQMQLRRDKQKSCIESSIGAFKKH